MRIEAGKELWDVIASYGELEWGHFGPVITDSFPLVGPPTLGWRYKSPNNMVEQGIQTAVKSYQGGVKWDISHGVKNWVIRPLKYSEFVEQEKAKGTTRFKAAFGDANPDFCWEAIRDVPHLAVHVKKVIDELLLQSNQSKADQ